MYNWFTENYIEVAGALLSILYLILSIRQNIWLWPVGIVSSLLYVIVFYVSKFYADMALNSYYFFISIYGWLYWSASKTGAGEELPVIRVGRKRALVLLIITMAIFLISGYVLDRFTDSPIPYWDALTTAGSIVATWMLTQKMLEHWLVWVVVDAISIALYIYRGLYPTSILFLVYTTMAVVGYRKWKMSIVSA